MAFNNIATEQVDANLKITFDIEQLGTYAMRKPGVPSAYQQCEYIESTGTQYLEINFNPNQSTNFEIDFMNLSYSTVPAWGTQKGLFGTRAGDNYGMCDVLIGIASGGWQCSLTHGSAYYETNDSTFALLNDRQTIKRWNGAYYLNGVKRWENTSQTYSVSRTLALFKTNYKGIPCQARVYGLKVWDGENLIRDMLPCYNKTSGVIGMYDTINDVFYTNKGSGTFIKGADV